MDPDADRDAYLDDQDDRGQDQLDREAWAAARQAQEIDREDRERAEEQDP